MTYSSPFLFSSLPCRQAGAVRALHHSSSPLFFVFYLQRGENLTRSYDGSGEKFSIRIQRSGWHGFNAACLARCDFLIHTQPDPCCDVQTLLLAARTGRHCMQKVSGGAHAHARHGDGGAGDARGDRRGVWSTTKKQKLKELQDDRTVKMGGWWTWFSRPSVSTLAPLASASATAFSTSRPTACKPCFDSYCIASHCIASHCIQIKKMFNPQNSRRTL